MILQNHCGVNSIFQPMVQLVTCVFVFPGVCLSCRDPHKHVLEYAAQED